MYQYWKIDIYKRTSLNSSEWSETPITINSFYSPQLLTSIGSGRDTFNFKVTNFNDLYNNYFTKGDKVVVSYVVNSSSFTESDIVMNGIIQNYPIELSGSSDAVSLSIQNYTELLMSALTFVKDENLTIPYFLKRAVERTNFFDSNFPITWHEDNLMVRSDGTPFPVVQEWWIYKSLLSLLEKYSSSEYTKDGNYYFYIDNNNKLRFLKRVSSENGSFNSSTDNYKSLKVSQSPVVINFAIMKGGTLPNGGTVTQYVDNPSSRVSEGFKPRVVVSDVNTGQNLINLDLGSNSSSRYPSVFPFTTAWKSSVNSVDAPSCSTNDYVYIADSGDSDVNRELYNFAIKREVKSRLKKEGRSLVYNNSVKKTVLDVTFSPGKKWLIGDTISCTVPEKGIFNKFLRVTKSNITATESYTLTEDGGE